MLWGLVFSLPFKKCPCAIHSLPVRHIRQFLPCFLPVTSQKLYRPCTITHYQAHHDTGKTLQDAWYRRTGYRRYLVYPSRGVPVERWYHLIRINLWIPAYPLDEIQPVAGVPCPEIPVDTLCGSWPPSYPDRNDQGKEITVFKALEKSLFS